MNFRIAGSTISAAASASCRASKGEGTAPIAQTRSSRSSGRFAATSLLQARRSADIPVISVVMKGANASDEVRNDFRTQVDDFLFECCEKLQYFRLENVHGGVSGIAWRPRHLFMERANNAVAVLLDDSTVAGRVGAKRHHRHRDIGPPGEVTLQKCSGVEVGQIVGMGGQKGLSLEERPVPEQCAAGAEQLLFMRDGNAVPPARLRDELLYRCGQVVRVDQHAFNTGGHEEVQPVREQGLALNGYQAFRYPVGQRS